MKPLAALLLLLAPTVALAGPEKPTEASLRRLECAKDERAVLFKYGSADARDKCEDGVYTAIRYGRTWVIFKSGGATYLMDHRGYTGPCLASGQSKAPLIDLCLE